jgi:hypothetical protein
LCEQASDAADVETKIAELGLNYFDFVILDEHLGEESSLGSEITQELRQRGSTSVVIACSGNCLPDDELR